MDSGNSGSLQSSSGGDEEYNSRAAEDSISPFLGSHRPPPHVGLISNPPPPAFDPLSTFNMQLQQSSYSSLLNPNMAWPAMNTPPLRSDPNTATHVPPSFQPTAAPGIQDNNRHGGGPMQQTAARSNPKKRSRASRRAPTTVLTTDTTNFRAMVQEFTGIPAPPFSGSTFTGSSRFDLFGTRTTALDAAPPYLRRPFAQKVQPPLQFLSSSSSSLSSSTTSAASSSTAPINFQQPPITQSSNLFNIQNPILTSLLQTSPKFFFSDSPGDMASKPPQLGPFEIPASNDHHPHMKMVGGLDEFGLTQENQNHVVTGLPSLISSDQIAPSRNDRNDNNTNENIATANWRNDNGDGEEDDGYQAQLRPGTVNGEYNFHHRNKRMNYSASSSADFHGGGEKGCPDNIAAMRGAGEGMVETWICSSELK